MSMLFQLLPAQISLFYKAAEKLVSKLVFVIKDVIFSCVFAKTHEKKNPRTPGLFVCKKMLVMFPVSYSIPVTASQESFLLL